MLSGIDPNASLSLSQHLRLWTSKLVVNCLALRVEYDGVNG